MGKTPLEKHGITIPKPQQSLQSSGTVWCLKQDRCMRRQQARKRPLRRTWPRQKLISPWVHGWSWVSKIRENHGKTWKHKNTDGDTGVPTPAVCENCWWCWCEISSPLGSVARCCHRSQAKDRRMPRAYNLAGEILLVTSEVDKNITSDIGKPFRGTSDFSFTWSCRHLSECLQA